MLEDGHNKTPRRTTLYAGSAACRVPGYCPASTAELVEAGPYFAYGLFHQKEGRGSPLSLLIGKISLPAEQAATYKGGGDYALALKGNQATLHDDGRLFFDDPARAGDVTNQTIDGDHGRIEARTASVSTDIRWLRESHDWPGPKAVGKVERMRETLGKTTLETAYYLLSPALSGERFPEVVRAHWAVENRLHWRLDVVMNED